MIVVRIRNVILLSLCYHSRVLSLFHHYFISLHHLSSILSCIIYHLVNLLTVWLLNTLVLTRRIKHILESTSMAVGPGSPQSDKDTELSLAWTYNLTKLHTRLHNWLCSQIPMMGKHLVSSLGKGCCSEKSSRNCPDVIMAIKLSVTGRETKTGFPHCTECVCLINHFFDTS